MTPREERGLVIAATARIQQKGKVWLVPSQTGNGGRYTVSPDDAHPHCSCPDHEETGCECKHIFAVRYVIQRELFDDGSVIEQESLKCRILIPCCESLIPKGRQRFSRL